MSETITYTCGVCGAHYEGPGHTCGEETRVADMYTRVDFEPLADFAVKVWMKAMDTQPDAPHIWNAVSRAVAAEVLSDPIGYARALGLPPPQDAHSAPVAGLG